MIRELILYNTLRFLRIIFDAFAYLIGLLYPKEQNYLPPITDRILLEPAISLSNKIKTGKLKSETVIRAFIERIKSVQPHINALCENRFADAVLEAIEIDKRVQNEIQGNEPIDGVSIHSQPFLGIPFTCKDGVMMKDMPYTAGSVKRKGIIAKDDCSAVKMMKKAGAIAIGITNTPEMLLWWDSYNKLYGRTDNPYDKSRIVGGSSGGEAALLSSAGTVIGIGTDLGGSIRMPSYFCGVFGHKTTSFIIPSDGLWPHHEDRDHMLSVGPMCRYARDLRPMLKAMAGPKSSLLKLDNNVHIKNLKVYYTEEFINDPIITPVNSEIKVTIKKVADYLNQKGAKVNKIKLKNINDAFNIFLNSTKSENAPKVPEELANRKGKINPMIELIKKAFGRSDHTNAAIVVCFLDKMRASEEDYKKFIELRDELKKQIHHLLGDDGILLYPTHPETAPKHNVTILKVHNLTYTAVFNALDVSITQVPMGLSSNGLPIGIQLIAGPYNDHIPISIAEELEKQFGGWTVPSKIVS